MVISGRTKLRILATVLLLILIAIGGSLCYVNFYLKTPEHALNAVQDAVKSHDIDEFNRYVDVQNVVAGVTNNMLDGIIASQSNLPEEAKVAVNSLATMFKAPLVASLNSGLTNFVKTGNWQTGTPTKDEEGAMVDSDMILDQIGVANLSFDGVENIEINKENKTAQADVKATQSEINQSFVFKVTLEEQPDGYWKVVSIDNFADFIKALEEGRREYMKSYMNELSAILMDKQKSLTENEAKLDAILSMGGLGNNDSRNQVKAGIENNILPQLKDMQTALQAIQVPKAAQTLHNLRLKSCENKIAYYENYAKWLDSKDIKVLREATDNLKKAKTMEYEADLLTKRIEGQL